VTQSLADSRYLVPHAGVPGTCVELIISSDHTAHERHKTRTSECCEFTHQVAEIAAIYKGLVGLRNRFITGAETLPQHSRLFTETQPQHPRLCRDRLTPTPNTRGPAETFWSRQP